MGSIRQRDIQKAEAQRSIQEQRDKNLPHMTWQDVLTVNQDSPRTFTPEEEASLNDYFKHFTPYPKNDRGKDTCLCGAVLLSSIQSIFLAGEETTTFGWGIQHGIAHCAKCKWPARFYHYGIGQSSEGGLEAPTPIFVKMEVMLLLHPDDVIGPGERNAATEKTDDIVH